MILLAIAINVKKAKMHLINAKLELGFAETKLFKKKVKLITHMLQNQVNQHKH